MSAIGTTLKLRVPRTTAAFGSRPADDAFRYCLCHPLSVIGSDSGRRPRRPNHYDAPEASFASGGSPRYCALGCNNVRWSTGLRWPSRRVAMPMWFGSSIAMLVVAASLNRCGWIGAADPTRSGGERSFTVMRQGDGVEREKSFELSRVIAGPPQTPTCSILEDRHVD